MKSGHSGTWRRLIFAGSTHGAVCAKFERLYRLSLIRPYSRGVSLRRRLDGRIPVFSGSGSRCIELADPARVRQLLLAPNVELVRRHKDRAVCEIHLLEYGDDSRLSSLAGNPQTLVHRAETGENPRRVWCLKSLVDVSAPDAE